MPTIQQALYQPVAADSGASSCGENADDDPIVFHFEDAVTAVVAVVPQYDGNDDDDVEDITNHGSLLSVHKHNKVQPMEIAEEEEDHYHENDAYYYGDNNHLLYDAPDDYDDSNDDNFSSPLLLFDFQDPWLPSVVLIVVLNVPILMILIHTFFHLIGDWFVATPFAVHLVVMLWIAAARPQQGATVVDGVAGTTTCSASVVVLPPVCSTAQCQRWTRRLYTSGAAVLDNVAFGWVYPTLVTVVIRNLCTDIDGTVVVEWSSVTWRLRWAVGLGVVTTVLRCGLGIQALGLRAATHALEMEIGVASVASASSCCGCCRVPTLTTHPWWAPFLYLDSRLQKKCHHWMVLSHPSQRIRMQRRVQWWMTVALLAAVGFLLVCVVSVMDHCVVWPVPPLSSQVEPYCDPLDDTECWLPFPSFHAMIPDPTTVTGWRVHLEGRLLPPLKSGFGRRRRRLEIQPDFLNQLDGFSTMAPMLFYLDGLKEAHEAGVVDQLPSGPDHISQSTTAHSVTLLLDVNARVLVPHTAELDYLDAPQHPIVLLFPAEPLHHNRHYAVAVVHAQSSIGGVRLPPTRGMQELFLRTAAPVIMTTNTTKTTNTTAPRYDPQRRQRYQTVVIPALEQAAPWLDYANDPDGLQLLFDFHTISAESQLGPVRAVRDATMKMLQQGSRSGSDADDGETTVWDWNNKGHVRTIRQIDYDCRTPGATLARTVHAALDVPWFLEGGYGRSGGRAAILTSMNGTTIAPVGLGVGKLLVHIPCSLRQAALADTGANDGNDDGNDDDNPGQPLRAVLEYGHGLFGHRGEAMDVVSLAHDEGYVVVAMDWRGMSTFDLLHVANVLLAAPRRFEAVRDNLIQGYANKFALQHFCRHGLLEQDWFQFERTEGPHPTSTTVTARVPTWNNATSPPLVFYGISQGGILGAGYAALAGVTHWMDRAVLGSPGTPFALILSRSLQFRDYDQLLLLNFYDNRHVRLLLSLIQMAWDSVEGSGVLARPVTEVVPPILMQAGLGDVIVPARAAEALARAFYATTVPSNPHLIFGVPVGKVETSNNTTNNNNALSRATLTEVMYDQEYLGLPFDNTDAQDNDIHICLRRDKAMIAQLTQFINTGTVIDPCVNDGCHRNRIQC